MHGLRRSFYYLLLFMDLIVMVSASSLAVHISRGRLPYHYLENLKLPWLPQMFTVLIFMIVWFFSSRITSLYDELKNFNISSEIFTLLQNIAVQLISGVLILFALKNPILSRFYLMVYLIAVSSGVLLLRIFYRILRKLLIRSGKLRKNVLLIGTSEFGKDFFGTPERSAGMGYNIAGYISDGSAGDNPGHLGGFDDIGRVMEQFNIDEVLITLNSGESGKLDHVMKILSGFPVRARVIPEYFRFISNKYQISFFNNIPVIDIRNDPLDELHWRILKRGFDLVFSLLFLLLIYSWLGLLIAAAVKITSRGPVYFKQERWGRKNRKFTLYKFRSMVKESRDTDEEGRFLQATRDDARITPIGRILRRMSLDELPQFLNVLKGDMSVVGPRPHAIPMNMESKDVIENYMLRHLVKPGITGWAQVNGFRGETRAKDRLAKRIEHDMFYIENWSFWFDLRIIFLTVWRGIKGDPNAF